VAEAIALKKSKPLPEKPPDDIFCKGLLHCTNSFYKLIAAGISETVLLKSWAKIETAIIFSSNHPLNLPTCRSWKSLKKHPEQIRSLAETLEAMNKDILLDPRTWLPVLYGSTIKSFGRDKRIFRIGEQFHKLPMLLRIYADYLEKLIPEIAKHRVSHPDETEIRTLTRHLLQTIRLQTKKYYLPDVQIMLEGAWIAANQKHKMPKITIEYLRGIVRSKTFQ
jgi:hypothetical protein